MARMPRVVMPGYPHYVTQRGNRRQRTFFCDDDYRYYNDLLSNYSKVHAVAVWAYFLMPNHVHLVMVPDKENRLRAVLGEAHQHSRTGRPLGVHHFVEQLERITGRMLRPRRPGRKAAGCTDK